MTHTTYGTSEEHGPAKRVSSFGKKLLAGSVVLCLVAAGTAVIGLSSTGEREGQRAEELTARVRQGMLMGEDGASPMHGDKQWDDFGSYKEVSTRCQQNTIPSILLCCCSLRQDKGRRKGEVKSFRGKERRERG